MNTTLRGIEDALPTDVLRQKTELTVVTRNLGYLEKSVQIQLGSPDSVWGRRQILEEVAGLQDQLQAIKNKYKLDNLLGAASFHAIASPALFDIERWIVEGVAGFGPDSRQVWALVQSRINDASVKASALDSQATATARDILRQQSARIAQFRKIATFGLIVVVLLFALLGYLILRQFRIERKLVESEGRFRDFANITSDYLWEVDEKLRLTYLSRKSQEISGIEPSKMIGRHCAELWQRAGGDEIECRELIAAMEAGKSIDGMVLECFNGDRQQQFLRIDGRPGHNKAGRFKGYRGGVKDVTELTAARKTAEEMKSAAESANQAKTRFLANMSHEIRTPLTLIVGMSDLMAETSDRDKQKKYLDIIQDASDTLLNLINRILDVSKIESDNIPISYVSFDVGEMVKQIQQAYSEIATGKNLVIESNVEPALDLARVGDRYRIEQVIRNLVDNALKFTEKGKIVIQVCRSDGQDANTLQFSIADSGPGIPEEKQAAIFDPFVQEDESTTRRYGGTGLGLAICKQLVNLMGGEIWLESKPGVGSTFSFTIRFDSDSRIQKAEQDAISLVDSSAGVLDILLVEDDEIIAMLIEEYLSDTPHRVSKATNGRLAVEAFRKSKPDLVFMDILMPEMDGYAATKNIREFERSENAIEVPIIALSASVLTSDIDHCLSVGFSDHISKPVHKETILNKVSQYAASA